MHIHARTHTYTYTHARTLTHSLSFSLSLSLSVTHTHTHTYIHTHTHAHSTYTGMTLGPYVEIEYRKFEVLIYYVIKCFVQKHNNSQTRIKNKQILDRGHGGCFHN